MKITVPKFLLPYVLYATSCVSAIGATSDVIPSFCSWPTDSLGIVRNAAIWPYTRFSMMPDASPDFVAVSRLYNLHAEPDKAYAPLPKLAVTPFHGLFVSSAQGDSLMAMMAVERLESPMEYQDRMVLKVRIIARGMQVLEEIIPLSGRFFQRLPQENTIRLSASNGIYNIELATPEFKTVHSGRMPYFTADRAGVMLAPGASVEIRNFAVLTYPGWKENNQVVNIDSLLEEARISTDHIEGVWEYMDRSLDESKLKMGGRYKVLVKKDSDGTYLLYYLSGAIINPDLWSRGMLKGRLRPTSVGKFITEWRDAEGLWMSDGVSAAMEDNTTLSILFPYEGSVMRLRRIEE